MTFDPHLGCVKNKKNAFTFPFNCFSFDLSISYHLEWDQDGRVAANMDVRGLVGAPAAYVGPAHHEELGLRQPPGRLCS